MAAVAVTFPRIGGLQGMIFRAVVFLTASLLAGCSSPAPSATSAGHVRTGFSKQPEVIYTPAGWPAALPADIYLPKGTGPWPAVLLIYGGNWNADDHRWQMRLLARKLAGRGYVVMNAAYRGAPKFPYPAPVDDLQEALRWLRAHAGEYRLQPDRIATYGFSAGGHLAALLGMRAGVAEVRVQAVVAASAPSDLMLFSGGEILPRFLGATLAEKPDLYRAASSVTHATSDDPPVFLYHGTDDQTVSPEHSKVFKGALDRAGVRNELHWVEGRGHASMLIFNGPAEAAAINFLDAVLR